MLRVGLTGGIGSGKSTVAAMLRELGAHITDADAVAREVVEPGQPALSAISDEFGAAVIGSDGSLDRAALAAVVFRDPHRLRALEAITGPAIAARVAQARGAVPVDRVDVYDMPLLVEKGLWVHEHLTMVVAVPADERVRRLVASRGMLEADARARIAAQATDDQRRQAADVWLPNDGTQGELRDAVGGVWHERLVPYDDNLRHGIPVRRPRPVGLCEPDPTWPAAGARVVARIAHALAGHGVEVDHVGSTSVADLVAKDVIDIQVGVRRLADADHTAFAAALARAGYLVRPDNRFDTPHPAGAEAAGWEKRYYSGCDPEQVVHLHVREIGSPGYVFALAFRDWLRAEPAARTAYGAEKRRAADVEVTANGDYTSAKEPYFEVTFAHVQEWIGRSGWTERGHRG